MLQSEFPKVVVGHRQLNENALERLVQLQAVNKISAELRVAQRIDAVFPVLADEMLAVLDAAAVSIWLYDAARGELYQAAGSGFPNINTRLKPGEGIAGQVFVTGQPYISREFKADPRTHESARDQTPAGLGGAAVPMRAADEIIGVLFASVIYPQELNPDQLRLLTIVAEIAGMGIHRIRLLELTERRWQRLSALQTINMALTVNLDPIVTLSIVLDQVMTQLNVDAADILRFNPKTQTFECAAARGFRNTNKHAGVILEDYLPRIREEQRMVHIPNLSEALGKTWSASPATAESFVTYYAVPIMVKSRLEGIVEIFNRSSLCLHAEELAFLQTLTMHAAIAIDNAMLSNDPLQPDTETTRACDSLIEGWARSVELREGEIEGHTRRVAEMTVRLAQMMEIPERELMHVRRGALLHDVGKMGIPDNILFKTGSLTQEELAIMRKHPLYAYDLLSPIPYLRPSLGIPYCHHEKWDGTGYPHGLRGDSIPLVARIFAVVDVWDALRSRRPFRQAWPDTQVNKRIRSLAGTHFDPSIVKKFMELLEETQSHTAV